ncbi:hypothetical protein ABE174_19465 [Bacillus subtilis]
MNESVFIIVYEHEDEFGFKESRMETFRSEESALSFVAGFATSHDDKKLVSAFSVNKEGLLTKYEVVFEGKLKFIEKNQ